MNALSSHPLHYIKPQVEALIFASDKPLFLKDISNCLNTFLDSKISETELEAFLIELMGFYQDNNFGFELIKSGGGYQFLTHKNQQGVISLMLQQTSKKKLSQTVLETLAIVAYKQPVTKTEIENIRGVGCDYTIQKLLERNLVSIAGKSNAPGRPILYATSDFFMEYFGINSIKDLPQLKELKTQHNEIGLTEKD